LYHNETKTSFMNILYVVGRTFNVTLYKKKLYGLSQNIHWVM